MDTLLLKYCLLLGIPLLVACASAPAQQQIRTPLIHFQKTPCLGTCPSYEATVYTEGTVLYKGYKHVPVTDTATFSFSREELESIKHEVETLQALQLQNTYLTQWSDMPATIITFYQNGKEVQRVKHQEGGPNTLIQFQEKLHLKLMQLAEAEAANRLPRH